MALKDFIIGMVSYMVAQIVMTWVINGVFWLMPYSKVITTIDNRSVSSGFGVDGVSIDDGIRRNISGLYAEYINVTAHQRQTFYVRDSVVSFLNSSTKNERIAELKSMGLPSFLPKRNMLLLVFRRYYSTDHPIFTYLRVLFEEVMIRFGLNTSLYLFEGTSEALALSSKSGSIALEMDTLFSASDQELEALFAHELHHQRQFDVDGLSYGKRNNPEYEADLVSVIGYKNQFISLLVRQLNINMTNLPEDCVGFCDKQIVDVGSDVERNAIRRRVIFQLIANSVLNNPFQH